MKKENTRRYLNIGILLFLLAIFFFNILLVPVENSEGAKNIHKFIFGGFYTTSILNELKLNNFKVIIPFLFFGVMLFYLNHFIFRGIIK